MLPWSFLLSIPSETSQENIGSPPRIPVWSQGIVEVSFVRSRATYPLEVPFWIKLYLGLSLPCCKFLWHKCLVMSEVSTVYCDSIFFKRNVNQSHSVRKKPNKRYQNLPGNCLWELTGRALGLLCAAAGMLSLAIVDREKNSGCLCWPIRT